MTEQASPMDRVRQWLETYGADDACAAHLLCDRYHPDSRAYRFVRPDLSTHDISYGELRRDSERFAAALASLGVKPGDRVATLMGKSRQFVVALMGIWRLGAVHVPLFTAFAPPAIALRLNGSGARVVVCDKAQQHKLEPSAQIPADAPWRVVTTGEASDRMVAFDALMAAASPGLPAVAMGGDAPLIHIYTSGTTGNPKGVVVPIRALASFHAYAEFAFDVRPGEDVFWNAADPGWAYGLYYGILTTFLTGVKSILLEAGFTPEATLAVLAQEEVSNFAAAPTIYRSLISSGLQPANTHLRCASSAGEPLTPEVNEWAQGALGVMVYDHYGQTEGGMLINNHHHPLVQRPLKPGSMGIVMPGWTAKILEEDREEEAPLGDVGRIAMLMPESPLAWFHGYDGDPAKTAEKIIGNGRWYITGDTGRTDEDGYFYFSSRDDDVILMAGYRIGPFEVESVMVTHPAIIEAAVIAVPDAVRGEVMEAFVVLSEGQAGGPELEKDIQQWVKTQYAAHAYPRKVHFAATLPKTPSGKIQRFVLKQQRKQELAGKADA